MRSLALFCFLFLSVLLKAEQLPETRPALIGSGPRSLINMINTERLMKRGQKDAMVMFTAEVDGAGTCWRIWLYGGTPDSDALAKEVSELRHVVFTPAVYKYQKRPALVDGTIIYRVIDGKPHLRIYLNQETERILRGEDFISPQWIFVEPDKHIPPRRYPEPGLSANVVIRITVDSVGKLQDAKLVFEKPEGHGFGTFFLNELHYATFLPGYLRGAPVACSANIEYVSKTRANHWEHWQPD